MNEERRQNLIKLASAVAFLAVVAVAVLIVVSQNQSEGGDAGNLEGVSEVERELAGIPQDGLAIGEPGAKVTLVEFGDLQCPFCRVYAEEALPQVIEGPVRRGDARLIFRNFTIIGQQSSLAAAAAVAAGEQGRGWHFVELFYRNQGIENSGYVTEEFLRAIAEAAGVPDIARWNREHKSKPVLDQVADSNAEAERLDLSGTPTFAIEGPGTSGLDELSTPQSGNALEAAIEDARR